MGFWKAIIGVLIYSIFLMEIGGQLNAFDWLAGLGIFIMGLFSDEGNKS